MTSKIDEITKKLQALRALFASNMPQLPTIDLDMHNSTRAEKETALIQQAVERVADADSAIKDKQHEDKRAAEQQISEEIQLALAEKRAEHEQVKEKLEQEALRAQQEQNKLREMEQQLLQKMHEDQVRQRELEEEAVRAKANLLRLKAEADRIQSERDQLEAVKAELAEKKALHEEINRRIQLDAEELAHERAKLEELQEMLAESEERVQQEIETARQERLKLLERERAVCVKREREEFLARCIEGIKRMALSASPTAVPEPGVDLKRFVVSLHMSGEFEIPDDVHVDKYTCSGFMIKLGRVHRNWLRRWFVFSLTTKTVTYYTAQNEKKVKGSFRLQDIIQAVEERTPETTHPTLHVVTPRRTYHFRCESAPGLSVWLDIINSVIERTKWKTIVHVPSDSDSGEDEQDNEQDA